ncbi:unnamed protein product, partial [Ixodes pacificus]
DYQIQNLLLYYDEKHQWPAVYKKPKTCHEKELVLNAGHGQILNLTNWYYPAECSLETEERKSVIRCAAQRRFKSARERWWFIAISNCNSSKGLYLKYKLGMFNHEKNFWYRQFSADEFCTYYPAASAGTVLSSVSTLIFLLLLILVAKGYTVTRGRLKSGTSAKIGTFMTIYVVVYSALFTYEQQYFDPGEVLYLYESPAGYGIVALRLVGWGWFVYATVFTLLHYPEKTAFYTRLFLLYTIWFLSAPVIILIAAFVVPKWMREKVINIVELMVILFAHIVFLVLTRPSRANKNFPFHVRTTQV